MDLINKCGCTSKKAVWALAGAWNPRCVAICNTMIQGYSPIFFSPPHFLMTDESRILKTNRYPLVNVYITMENQPLLMGKLAISVAIVSSFFCMFTRPGRPYRSNPILLVEGRPPMFRCGSSHWAKVLCYMIYHTSYNLPLW